MCLFALELDPDPLHARSVCRNRLRIAMSCEFGLRILGPARGQHAATTVPCVAGLRAAVSAAGDPALQRACPDSGTHPRSVGLLYVSSGAPRGVGRGEGATTASATDRLRSGRYTGP